MRRWRWRGARTGWFAMNFPLARKAHPSFPTYGQRRCHLVGRGPLWVTEVPFLREPFGKPGKATSASSVRGERSDVFEKGHRHRVRRARISLVDRESFAIWSTGVRNDISAFQPLARAGPRRSHAEMESSGRCSPGRVAPLRPARPAAAAACPPDPNCHAQHRASRAQVEHGPADGAREARAAAHQQQLDLEMYCEFWHGIFADVLGRAYCCSSLLGSS